MLNSAVSLIGDFVVCSDEGLCQRCQRELRVREFCNGPHLNPFLFPLSSDWVDCLISFLRLTLLKIIGQHAQAGHWCQFLVWSKSDLFSPLSALPFQVLRIFRFLCPSYSELQSLLFLMCVRWLYLFFQNASF